MSFTSLIARSAAQTGTIGGGLGTAAAARSAVQTGTIGGGSGAAAVASLPNSNILDAINSVREYKAPPAPCGAGKSLDIGGSSSYTSSPIACSASSAGSVGGGSGAAAAA